jgi:hypothetical protein
MIKARPLPTIAVWKSWLGEQPRHDRHREQIGAKARRQTRRNIESLLSQFLNYTLADDPLRLLTRNPCTSQPPIPWCDGRLARTNPHPRVQRATYRQSIELLSHALLLIRGHVAQPRSNTATSAVRSPR